MRRIIMIIFIALLIAGVSLMGVVAKAYTDEPIEFGKILLEELPQRQYLYDLADSIANCEGYYAGNTRAWRNRNPGNIKSKPPYDNKGHSIYPTHVEGWLTLYRLLSTKYDGKTPYQMNRIGYAVDPVWYVCVDKYLFAKQKTREKL